MRDTHDAVLVTARGAMIFNVVVFCSFLLTVWECGTDWSSSKRPEPHVMHPLLFKASFEDGTAATIVYLVIGIGLCLILRFCMFACTSSCTTPLQSCGARGT